jgi:hypothetical protein
MIAYLDGGDCANVGPQFGRHALGKGSSIIVELWYPVIDLEKK